MFDCPANPDDSPCQSGFVFGGGGGGGGWAGGSHTLIPPQVSPLHAMIANVGYRACFGGWLSSLMSKYIADCRK